MLQVVVCMKVVPDTTQVRIDPETNTLIREGVPSIINPFDVHAIEEGVRLKERYGGRVTLVSMGPPNYLQQVRKGLSFGADHAVFLSDRALGGADTLATSYTLSRAIQCICGQDGGPDVVLCGKQTIDGDTAQVGPGIATRLGLTQFSYVEEVVSVEEEARRIRVRRHLEGATEVVEGPLPALLTILREANTPRYASLPALMRALRYDIPIWRAAEIGADPDQIGMKGSPTSVRRIFAPAERAGGEIIAGGLDNPQGAASALVERLLASGSLEA